MEIDINYLIKIIKSKYEKTTDNEIMMLVHYAENKQKEIEEKTTIILAGAEKVKALEKEIEELKQNQCNHNISNECVSKQKIINALEALKNMPKKKKIDKICITIAEEVLNVLLEGSE